MQYWTSLHPKAKLFIEKRVEDQIILKAKQSIGNVEAPKIEEKLAESLKQTLNNKPVTTFCVYSLKPLSEMVFLKTMPCASDSAWV